MTLGIEDGAARDMLSRSCSPPAATLFSLAVPTPAPVVPEPKTGVTFEMKVGDMSLLGIGLRTKTFLKFKVYALGLYVADSALSGPLTVHRGKVGTSAFYQDLITGDFEKQFVLKLVRDLSADQIQGTFRSHMPSADPRAARPVHFLLRRDQGGAGGRSCAGCRGGGWNRPWAARSSPR